MNHQSSSSLGLVAFPRHRPATQDEIWVDLYQPSGVAIEHLVAIDGPGQTLLGIINDLELVEEREPVRTRPMGRAHRTAHLWARVVILSASDHLLRPPLGTRVRAARAEEISQFAAEARQIRPERRVPLGVLAVDDGFARISIDLEHLAGPTATSMLISGAAGSYKSTAGGLTMLGAQLASGGRAALVLINSKGGDFLFGDFARTSRRIMALGVPPLCPRDLEIYATMGYPEPPTFHNFIALVPETTTPSWRSVRPATFRRTRTYRLSLDVGIRHARTPMDDAEKTTTAITQQCISFIAGEWAQEMGLRTLPAIVAALRTELVSLGDKGRWRGQFLPATVGAALRQLSATERELGPILAPSGEETPFPFEILAGGGTLVIDVSTLPASAAPAVIDEAIRGLWDAKESGIIPHDVFLLLLVDELNRWSNVGPTAARIAAVVRDQRHRRFGLVGLAQQLSTLHPQLVANADSLFIGSTRALEAMQDVYMHLPENTRRRLHRLPTGHRLLDAWPLPRPMQIEIPYPSWLVSDEGRLVIDAWRSRQAEQG